VPRDFYVFLVSRFAAGAAMTLLRAAVAWHVFELTGSAFYLGLTGIVQFVPALGLMLIGGAVADSHDRRRVINAAQLVLLAAGGALLYATGRGEVGLYVLYAAVAAVAAAGAFEAPARQALLPTLVPRERFPRAVTIASTNQALAFVTGPALGGLVIAQAGVRAAYGTYVVLVLLAFVSTLSLGRPPEPSVRRAASVASVLEGLRFVWSKPVILGCMSLDMFAVIFGGATALLPIYAKDILQVGASGYGVLTSTFELGALAMSVVLMVRPPVARAGRTLLIAVAIFGAATIVFGLSRAFPLTLAAYALAGMADQISVVMRATAVQLSTPDELRGRVSAVNMLFIGASNQLGAAESGFVAHLTSPEFAVVSGGVVCLLVVAFIAYKLPELRRYEASGA
jgi:MFS family permease